MDEKVKALFSRVREAAQNLGSAAETTARSAGRKAGNLIDVTRLNVQIYELNSEVNGLLRDAGQILYDAHLGLETDDELVAGILSRLDVKNAQIMELRERVDALKQTKPCPYCGGTCSGEALFFKHCGKEL